MAISIFLCDSQPGTIVNSQTSNPVTVVASQVQYLSIDLGLGNDVIDLGTIANGQLSATATVTLKGGAGADTITGSGYGDLIYGGDGNDILNGKTGSDTYFFDSVGAADTDKITEGPNPDIDTFDFSAMTSAVNADLRPFSQTNGNQIQVNSALTIVRGNLNIDSLIIERLVGTPYDDILAGTWVTSFKGGAGADTFHLNGGSSSIEEQLESNGTVNNINYAAGTHTVSFQYNYAGASKVEFSSGRTFSQPTIRPVLAEVIDAMFVAINSGSFEAQWDFTGDGVLKGVGGQVTAGDSDSRKFIVDIAGKSFGDVNLDGDVDSDDLNIMGIHWQQAVDSWAFGDVNGDGVVNSADLNLLGINWNP